MEIKSNVFRSEAPELTLMLTFGTFVCRNFRQYVDRFQKTKWKKNKKNKKKTKKKLPTKKKKQKKIQKDGKKIIIKSPDQFDWIDAKRV